MADGYTFDPATGRYTDPAGHLVPADTVQAGLDAVIQDSQDRLAVLADRWTRGTLGTADLRDAVQRELRVGHGLAATLAHGGLARMTAAQWGYVGSQLRWQYGYLQNFALAVAADQAGSDAQIAARLQLYASAYHGTYTGMQARDAGGRGMRWERNRQGSGNPCPECEALSQAGWVPYGQTPLPGSRLCQVNCRCTLEYAAEAPAAVGA